MTQPGNLQCKKILHLVGQTDPIKINTVVKDALKKCVKDSYTSVSFPAIGTGEIHRQSYIHIHVHSDLASVYNFCYKISGQGNVKAKQVADAMMDAVIDVLSQYPTAPMKTVRVVIFQPPMLKDFYDSMHEREGTGSKADPKNKAGFLANLGAKIKGEYRGKNNVGVHGAQSLSSLI